MKKTKHALLLSAVSMLLCLSMLVGSTFAWFTDTASTGVNKIVAGNLDMKVYYATCSEGTDAEYAELAESTNVFKENTLWEPGHVEVVHLKVENVGSLAFKYKIAINIPNEKTGVKVVNGENTEFKLSDYIKYAVVEGNQEYDNSAAAIAAAEAATNDAGEIIATEIKNAYTSVDKTIEARGAAQEVTLIVYMPTTVGNEANHTTGTIVNGVDTNAPIIDLGIAVYAAQATVEEDSFGSDYDKNAEYDKLKEYESEGYEFVQIPEDTAAENVMDTVIETLKNSTEDKVAVELPAGEFVYDGKSMSGKDVVFAGTENSVVDATSMQINSAQDLTNTTLTFDGVTVNWAEGESYQGIKNPEKVVYKNCVINGLQYLYGDAEFINCTFTNRNGWSVILYGEVSAIFTNCTFNTGNHAVLLYMENGTSGDVTNATLNNCTFNNDGSQIEQWGSEQLVECGDNVYGGSNVTYRITFNDCTIKNTNNANKALWGNKDNMSAERLTITVDGVAQNVSNHPTATNP